MAAMMVTVPEILDSIPVWSSVRLPMPKMSAALTHGFRHQAHVSSDLGASGHLTSSVSMLVVLRTVSPGRRASERFQCL